MKKQILTILFFALCLSLSAQQPYNGSFEQWSSPSNPDGWGTWATAIGQFNGILGDTLEKLAQRDTTTHANYPNDTVSVKLVVDEVTFPFQGVDTVAGFISLGGAFYVAPPDTAPGLYYGYYPYSQKPDSLIFDYKYVPAGNNDSALVIMTMQRFDSLSQTEQYFLSTSWLLTPTPQWTHQAYALSSLYTIPPGDTLPPDSIQIIVLSSIQALHVGTALWIDSIHFDASVNIIIDTFPAGIVNTNNLKGVTVYPNPTANEMHILVPESGIGSGLQLYDANGREVYNGRITETNMVIDTRRYTAGIYAIQVHCTDHLTIYKGKISIVHTE